VVGLNPQSHEAGKSGIVMVILAPGARLLDRPLRKVKIASLHQADRNNSEMPCCTTGKLWFEVDAHLVRTIAFGGHRALNKIADAMP
jgi:hypothetical protein